MRPENISHSFGAHPPQGNVMTSVHEKQLRPRQDLIVEEIDGECLVLDMERNVYFGLDPIGLFVWRQLEQGATSQQALDALIDHYGEDHREQITEDVRGFLEDLLAQGLVEPRGDE